MGGRIEGVSPWIERRARRSCAAFNIDGSARSYVPSRSPRRASSPQFFFYNVSFFFLCVARFEYQVYYFLYIAFWDVLSNVQFSQRVCTFSFHCGDCARKAQGVAFMCNSFDNMK